MICRCALQIPFRQAAAMTSINSSTNCGTSTSTISSNPMERTASNNLRIVLLRLGFNSDLHFKLMESFQTVAVDKHPKKVRDAVALRARAGVWKTRDLHVSFNTDKSTHSLTVLKELLCLRVAKGLEQRVLSKSRTRTLPEMLRARTAGPPSVFPAPPVSRETRVSCFVLAEPPSTPTPLRGLLEACSRNFWPCHTSTKLQLTSWRS